MSGIRELVTTRTFEAPRELVWEVWTKPEHVAKWWGPNGFTTATEVMDVRPGGVWRHVMQGPDGVRYPNEARFIEVEQPRRLVYSHGGHREDGPAVRFTSTVTFEECMGRTTVTMNAAFDSAEELEFAIREFGADEGGKQHLANLEAYVTTLLPAEPIFAITRTFNAPRELVFQAWSEADRLNEWWGPKGYPTRSLKLDFRPGGVYHYCSEMPDGSLVYGTFLYREIVVPEKIVYLSGFADADCNLARHPMMPDWPRQILNTLTLEEHNGKTTLTLRGGPHEPTEAEVVAFREALKYLTPGFSGTLEQLEAYLAREQAGK